MKRNRQHIIEDESENILKSLIPTEWVLRKLIPDYGIDYDVEIFENEAATGLHFFLQLKGTDKKEKDDTISIQLDRKYIEYYQLLALPILFVYVSVKSKKVWAKWLNRCAINKKYKSRTLKFTPNDILNQNKISNIKDNLNVDHSLIRIRYSNCNDDLKHLMDRWLNWFFKENITDDDSQIADEIIISLAEESGDNLLLNISDERFLFERQVKLLLNIKEELLRMPEIDDLPDSLNRFFYEFSKILLVRNSDSGIYAQLKILPDSDFGDLINNIVPIVSKCILKGLYQEIEQFGIAIVKKKKFDIFQFVFLALFKDPENKRLNQIKENLLLTAIKYSEDKELTGMLHYNLANHYQNMNSRRKAIFNYLDARRNFPEYLNRGYWYRELAGMFFLEKRYSISAKLYAKCLTFERHAKQPINKALTADAYFMARQFDESLKWFEEYASEVDHREIEFIFKKQIIKTIKDDFDLKKKYFPKRALLRYQSFSNQNDELSLEQIYKCLEEDPISSEVRFQEGIYLQKIGKFEEACISFLISALVNEWNIPAWFNSVYMAMDAKSHLVGKILFVAYKKHGFGLIDFLREEGMNSGKASPGEIAKVIDSMRSQFEIYENMEKDNKKVTTHPL